MPQPGDRPNIEDILQCLEKVSRSWTPDLAPAMAGSLAREFSDTSILRGTDALGVFPSSEVVSHQPKLGIEEAAGIINGVCLTCS